MKCNKPNSIKCAEDVEENLKILNVDNVVTAQYVGRKSRKVNIKKSCLLFCDFTI